MISPNYASGERASDEIFGLRGTRFLMFPCSLCSLMVVQEKSVDTVVKFST